MAFACFKSLGHKWQRGSIRGDGLYLGCGWDGTGGPSKLLTFHFWDSTKITNNKLKLKHVVKMVHVMSVEGIQRKTRETLLDSGAHTWISYLAECWGILMAQPGSWPSRRPVWEKSCIWPPNQDHTGIREEQLYKGKTECYCQYWERMLGRK